MVFTLKKGNSFILEQLKLVIKYSLEHIITFFQVNYFRVFESRNFFKKVIKLRLTVLLHYMNLSLCNAM